MDKIVQKTIQLADRPLTLEVGRVADQADGAVLARYGDTVVLATVVMGDVREDLSYFPLVVDFEEKLYAGGKIKTSRFVKREGRPSDEAILAGRMIDRSIRPLFPKDFYNEIQVIITMLSVDQENDPATLGMVAAFAALAVSPIPWQGPLGVVRVGFRDGHFLLNPGNGELAFSDLDLVVSASKEGIVMVEADAKQLPENEILQALEFGFNESKKIIELIEALQEEVGKPKVEYEIKKIDEDVKEAILTYVLEKLPSEVLSPEKVNREDARRDFLEELYGVFEGKVSKNEINEVFYEAIKTHVRKKILEQGVRPDGRKSMTEVRPLQIEIGILPRTHGSALFRRGETQVLTIATLGSTSLEQLIEGPTGEETKRYMHHYNFPPFSTGETGRLGWPGRREVGHGALAERALLPVIPSEGEFPYAIRLVSEVLSSSGSTSMAAVCGSTLALMDAGIPIQQAVAGVAMGLISDEKKGRFEVLTDIQAQEDFCGDMDFKVAGTKKGITALQMDTKLKKVSSAVLKLALEQAHQGRLVILEKMQEVIAKPREKLSQYAPRVTTLKIDSKKIGAVIGAGGKIIRNIQENTETIIDIKEDGQIFISGSSDEGAQKAKEMIEAIVKEVKAGDVYKGKVTRITDFGAFIEVLPGKEGLAHISELSDGYVSRVADVVKVGDEIEVKVVNVDDLGRINLSAKKHAAPARRNFNRHRDDRTPGRPVPGRGGRPYQARSGPGYRTPYHQRPGFRRK